MHVAGAGETLKINRTAVSAAGRWTALDGRRAPVNQPLQDLRELPARPAPPGGGARGGQAYHLHALHRPAPGLQQLPRRMEAWSHTSDADVHADDLVGVHHYDCRSHHLAPPSPGSPHNVSHTEKLPADDCSRSRGPSAAPPRGLCRQYCSTSASPIGTGNQPLQPPGAPSPPLPPLGALRQKSSGADDVARASASAAAGRRARGRREAGPGRAGRLLPQGAAGGERSHTPPRPGTRRRPPPGWDAPRPRSRRPRSHTQTRTHSRLRLAARLPGRRLGPRQWAGAPLH